MIRLAYDVGPGAGLGHRSRMRALAAALGHLGHDCELAQLGSARVADDVVVLDSYRARADDGLVRARRTVAIDDLGRDQAVDLVVDPSPQNGVDGTAEVRARRVLRGLPYALIDPALAAREPTWRDVVTTVLVTSGGTDVAGLGAGVAAAVRASLPNVTVRLVVGPWSEASVPDGVEAIDAPDGLSDELAAADVVVSASGVTLLEGLALGRPTVAFATADNQLRYLSGLAHAGAVIRTTADGAAMAAVRVTTDSELRRQLAATAQRLVDGHGAVRVATAVAELV